MHFHIYEIPRGAKSIETESRMVGTRVWGREALVFNGDGVSVWEDGEALCMGGGDGCTAVRMHLMPLSCTLENS